MSFDLLLEKSQNSGLVNTIVYPTFDHEIYFVPSGRNYFTRVRCFGSDYYIEYCDDYKKPLDDKVIVVRKRDDMVISLETIIVNHILQHPKNKPQYKHFKECLKELDKEFYCEVIDNEAFVRPHDQQWFTKLIGETDKIKIEYYNERYVLLPETNRIVLNDDDTGKMVKYLKETIYCHPKLYTPKMFT